MLICCAEHLVIVDNGRHLCNIELSIVKVPIHSVHRTDAVPRIARRSRRPSLLPVNSARLGAPSETIRSNRSAQASRASRFSLS